MFNLFGTIHKENWNFDKLLKLEAFDFNISDIGK